jgi:ATP-binding cassette, subfamily C (CFTR/MRP), member 4
MNHKEHQQRPSDPHKDASRISKMSFWYTRKLYQNGLSRPILPEDVYETSNSHESNRIAEKFSDLWKQELKTKNPSVLRMFYNAYGGPMLLIGFLFSIVETINRCAQPLFLGALLSYFADPSISRETAYLYASGIVLCSLIPVITFHPFIYYIMETGLKIRIGASRLVYDKVKVAHHCDTHR